MTSRYVIMERVASAGYSVTRFTSRSWQPPFASTNDGTASRASITKAIDLSNATGAQRL